MKTVLVLAPHPDFAEAVRSALSPEEFRVIHRHGAEEAEPFLRQGLLDACLLDVASSQIEGLWMLERVRLQAPRCPVVIYTDAKSCEWEEEAYLQGVRHVLTHPVRPRLLNALLNRLLAPAAPAAPALAPAPPASSDTPSPSGKSEANLRSFEALGALRDFSAILGNSLCAEALLKQFLLLLREIIGVNRSAVFLRAPGQIFGGQRSAEEGRRLRSACAIGLPQGLVENLALSLDSGIGRHVDRHGRILRRDSREAQGDAAVMKEFELLGVEVAVPMLDLESVIGVALFDGRVTGESLTNTELQLVFHLLEAVGLAVKNIRLHQQLATNHEMMADVLRQLNTGCVVVGRDLGIQHINRTARAYFTRPGRRGSDFEFSDLPAALGSKVYQVLKTGAGLAPFKFQPPESPNTLYQVTILPVQPPNMALPTSVLLMVEDHSQHEQLQRLEIEAANLRLVKQMADRLAHEVGNALVPLSTHQQLFAKKYEDPEFRASLDTALADGVRRVTRLTNQMRFLARDAVAVPEAFPLAPLIDEAYQEAQKYQPVKSAQLKYNLGKQAVMLSGDRASLKHAMAEILLNALQANPNNARIAVETKSERGADTGNWVQIEFRDNGSGFSPEAAKRVPEPFYTTRNVGLGLGLVVSRKVVETHRGKLEVVPPQGGQSGVVRLSLPLATPPAAE
jgi:nitrogen-specific signal transduction histidine kinase